jgi:hypothetical protein
MTVSRPFVSRHSAALGRVALGMALGMALGASGLSCVERSDDLGATGSETHFLLECSERCEAGFECMGGVCTSPCTSDAVCTAFSPAASCSAPPGAAEPGVCDVQCTLAGDCASLGAGYRCQAGSCRSATSVGVGGVAASLPPVFDVLELRRIDNDEPPGPGSDCDPRALDSAYFIDLSARQVSSVSCFPRPRTNVWLGSSSSWAISDADRDALLAAYAQLQVGVSEACSGPGGTFIDVTTADSARFSYGDESYFPCDVGRIGRTPIANVLPLYQTLVILSLDASREQARDGSSDR